MTVHALRAWSGETFRDEEPDDDWKATIEVVTVGPELTPTAWHDAAEEYRSEHEGDDQENPATIAVVVENEATGERRVFDVERDYEPVFTARLRIHGPEHRPWLRPRE